MKQSFYFFISFLVILVPFLIHANSTIDSLAFALEDLHNCGEYDQTYPLLGPWVKKTYGENYLVNNVIKETVNGVEKEVDLSNTLNIYQFKVIDQYSLSSEKHCAVHAARNLLYLVNFVQEEPEKNSSHKKKFEASYVELLNPEKFKAFNNALGCPQGRASGYLSCQELKKLKRMVPQSMPTIRTVPEIVEFDFFYSTRGAITKINNENQFTIDGRVQPLLQVVPSQLDDIREYIKTTFGEEIGLTEAASIRALEMIQDGFLIGGTVFLEQLKKLHVADNYLLPVIAGYFTSMQHGTALLIHKYNGVTEFLFADSVWNTPFSTSWDGNTMITLNVIIALATLKTFKQAVTRMACRNFYKNQFFSSLEYVIEQFSDFDKGLFDQYYKEKIREAVETLIKKLKDKNLKTAQDFLQQLS